MKGKFIVTPDMVDYPFTEDWTKGFRWYKPLDPNQDRVLEESSFPSPHTPYPIFKEDPSPPPLNKNINTNTKSIGTDEFDQLKGLVLFLQSKLNEHLDKAKKKSQGKYQ